MTQYSIDFSEYTTGQNPPTGWTKRWNTSCSSTVTEDVDATGGKKLVSVASASGRRMLSFDSMDGTTDFDILTSFTLQDTSSFPIGIYARASGSPGNETGYGATVSLASKVVHTGRYVNGTWTTIAEVGCTFTTTGKYLCRFKLLGTAIKFKLWNVNSLEPSEWLLESTDSTISSGWAGVGGNTARNTLDYIIFDTAATPEVLETPSRVSMLFPFAGGSGNSDIATYGHPAYIPADAAFLLTGVAIYSAFTHTSQVRVAVYSGGSLSGGPDGATLIHDFGQTVGSDTGQPIILSCSPVAIPADAPVWVFVKNTADFGLYATTSRVGNAGSFRSSGGFWSVGADIGTDIAVGYPSTLSTPTAVSVDKWFAAYLTMSEAVESDTAASMMFLAM